VTHVDDRRQIGPCRRSRVIEIGMAAKAQRPLLVQGQEFDVIRMTGSGTVAVLALDALVRTTPVGLEVVLVALGARVLALVLDGKLFPLLHVSLTIEIVGEAVAMNAEIIRHQEEPGDKDQTYETDCHPQRVKHVSLHRYPFVPLTQTDAQWRR